MSRRRVIPNVKTYSSVAHALGKADPERAIRWFQAHYRQTSRNLYVWAAVVGAVGRTNRCVLSTVERMRKHGVTPDQGVYGTALAAACRQQNIGGAQSLLESMRKDRVFVNERHATTLLAAYIKTDNTRLATELVAEVEREKSFNPSREFLSVQARLLCKTGSDAVQFVTRFAPGRIPDPTFVGLALVCDADNDLASAMQLLTHVSQPQLCAVAFMHCMKLAARVGTFSDVTHVFEQMGAGRDLAAWTAYLAQHAKQRVGNVLRLIDRMEAEGIPRTTSVYRKAIESAEECMEFSDARLLLALARSENLRIVSTIAAL
ncbi:hypothetical protein DIPPA_34941 [Diplonema papillatum]|nr:hypothetical protein DIPPA_34941 [Diplonema papillatum]